MSANNVNIAGLSKRDSTMNDDKSISDSYERGSISEDSDNDHMRRRRHDEDDDDLDDDEESYR